MREAGEKNSEAVKRAAGQRDDARSFAIQPEATKKRGKSQNENADRKSESYLRNAPAELLCQRRAENAPRVNGTKGDLEERSCNGDYPTITRFHDLITTALPKCHSWESHRRLPCRS